MYTFFLILLYYITIYYLYIYKLLPYYLSINQYFTWVVSYYFLFLILLPYYFFDYNTPVQHIFLLVFTSILSKNRKKSDNFLQFFLSVYQ